MPLNRKNAGSLSFAALMCALLIVCSQIQIPLPGVPINLALFAVEIGAMLLGPLRACAVVFAYLLLGAFGLPVFSGFGSGPAVLFGPTGGFLFGYLLCALITGALSRRAGASFLRLFAAALIGMAACCVCGVLWFMVITAAKPTLAFFAYFLVFLPGDIIKAVLASALYIRLQKPLHAMGIL